MNVPTICRNPTPVFDTYFRFAAERHQIYLKRLRGYTVPEILTNDPILQTYRFTNVFRAADRVSQYLIREIIPKGSQKPMEVLFRILLFKIFNKIETWERLTEILKETPTWAEFSLLANYMGAPQSGFAMYGEALQQVATKGPLYSAAYVMPNPPFGHSTKADNHLALITQICWNGDLVEYLAKCTTTQHDMFHVLLKQPSLGSFLAYQFTIDLTYSKQFYSPDHGFVVAGPGARDGIKKCFGLTRLNEDEAMFAIQYTANIADQKFAELGLVPPTLHGHKLELIDYQNLFCEVDKYSRVAHPEVVVGQKRVKIKRRYTPNLEPMPPFVAPENWEEQEA
jgi:hypothetical protein